jgi:hypothetical protein
VKRDRITCHLAYAEQRSTSRPVSSKNEQFYDVYSLLDGNMFSEPRDQRSQSRVSLLDNSSIESYGQPLRNALTAIESARCFDLSIGHLVPLWLVRRRCVSGSPGFADFDIPL